VLLCESIESKDVWWMTINWKGYRRKKTKKDLLGWSFSGRDSNRHLLNTYRQGNQIFLFSKRLDQLWGPPSLSYSIGTGVLSWGVKWPGRDIDHLPSSSAKVKNECSYTSTPPIGPCSCRGPGQLCFWWAFYFPNTSETLLRGPISAVGMFTEVHVFRTVPLQPAWIISTVC
jgi:hypothetical protein